MSIMIWSTTHLMRTNWKNIWKHPLKIQALLKGRNVRRGKTSSIKWFPNVSTVCHRAGAWGDGIHKRYVVKTVKLILQVMT